MQTENAGAIVPMLHLGGGAFTTRMLAEAMEDEFKVGGEFGAMTIGGSAGLDGGFQPPLDHGEIAAIDFEGGGGREAFGESGPADDSLLKVRFEDLAGRSFARRKTEKVVHAAALVAMKRESFGAQLQ